MILIKKLTFAPLFLVLLTSLLYFVSPLLKSTDLIFSLNWQIFTQLIILSTLILSSALTFAIFAALSSDWKLILPVILVSGFIPLLFNPPMIAGIFGVGIIVALSLSYLTLEGKMKGYLTFQAPTLLSPAIKQLITLLILTLSLTYYLSINKDITEKGFEIPDSLIDNVLQMMPQTSLPVQGFKQIAQLPTLTPEQIELLKQNPDLLRQYGIDPKTLDSLPTSSKSQPNGGGQPAPNQASSFVTEQTGTLLSNPSITALVKPLIKEQLQNIIKPYQKIIPGVLGLFLFLTLQSFVSILGIFLSPAIWLTFYILEKTNFVRFEVQMRQVKKLVV